MNAKKNYETGLYYYGARFYDPRFSFWYGVDPLAEKFPGFSPYNYCLNNPVMLVDPDGRSAASPIFGLDGEFLGTDSEGFKGELLFMDKQTFDLLGGQGMDHSVAEAMGSNLNQVIGDNPATSFTQNEIEMVNSAINFVASKTEGYDGNFSSSFGRAYNSNLLNGSISSSYYEQGRNTNPPYPEIWLSSNNGNNLGGVSPSLATTDQNKITHNLQEFRSFGLTVGNIQNTFVHEYGGHLKRKIPGGENASHAQAIILQANHSSWGQTTAGYRENMRTVYQQYTGKPLRK